MTAHDPLRRARILRFIDESTAERGYAPTVKEIADAVGLASTSAATWHLDVLESYDLITRDPTTARSIRTTTGHAPCPTCGRGA